MRVLMLTGAYFPEISGAGLQCKSLIQAVNDRNTQFSVVTTCLDKSLPFRDRVDGVAVYRLPVGGKGGLGTLCAWLPRLFYLFFKELARADIIHLHGISRKSYFFLLAGFILRKPVLLKITSLGEDDPQAVRQKGLLHSLFYNLACYYLVPSPALERALLESGTDPERLFYLPNGVDLDRFRPAAPEEKHLLRSKLGLSLDQLLIFFTGHYSLDKRPHLLAEVWSGLKRKGVGLVLLGSSSAGGFEISPEAVRRVKETASKDSLPGSIVMKERSERIEDYFRACDIFVSPSVREGMPNALLEAMASGLACAAVRLEGITDILLEKEDCGLLFEPDDREVLAGILDKLTASPELCQSLGAKASKRVSADYDIRLIARQYIDFISRF